MPIFVGVLSVPTGIQLCEGADMSNNWDIFSFNTV